MKHSIIKTFSIILSTALIVSCGGGKEEEEFKFYALKEAASQQLELTVEASGTVEAISSIEIKSKSIQSSLLQATIDPIQYSMGLNLLISISFSTINRKAGLCTLPPRANLLTFFHKNSDISYPIR